MGEVMMNKFFNDVLDDDTITLKKINDEGHGWVIASLGMLRTLDLVDKISS